MRYWQLKWCSNLNNKENNKCNLKNIQVHSLKTQEYYRKLIWTLTYKTQRCMPNFDALPMTLLSSILIFYIFHLIKYFYYKCDFFPNMEET